MKTENKSTNVQNEKNEMQNVFNAINKTMFKDKKSFTKHEIYKKIAFYHALNLDSNEILSNDLKKTAKRKIRNIKENLCFAIIRSNDIAKKHNNLVSKNQLIECINQFDMFYKSYFVSNDYTLESICSSNTTDENKQLFSKALKIIIENKH